MSRDMKITLCDHHAARPSPRAQMIVRLEWLFILLVALSLMVRPVPVALAEVPDGITTNDEHQPYQFDVNAARLGRRRVQGHTSERARWIELDVETATRILGDDWRRLIEMLEAPPTGDPLWQRVYWRAFHARGPSPRVHVLCGKDGVAAVIPVRPTGGLVRQWSSGVTAHTPCWTLALARSPHVAGAALEHLMASAQMLNLGPLYARGVETEALARAARERGFRVSQDMRGAEAVIDLPASPAEFPLSRNLISTTLRKKRQLARLGELEFDVVTGGPALQQVLAECFALETLGWKGQRGAPIISQPDTLQFYSELAEASAAAGRLALYTLRLNSTLIAFEYCLRHNGRIDMLKLSYHPRFGHHSPGNVLRLLVLEGEIKSGETRSYHMGLASEWKTRWATRLEPLCWLGIYDRGFRGTVAYLGGTWSGRLRRRTGRLRRRVGRLRDAGRRLLGRWPAA